MRGATGKREAGETDKLDRVEASRIELSVLYRHSVRGSFYVKKEAGSGWGRLSFRFAALVLRQGVCLLSAHL